MLLDDLDHSLWGSIKVPLVVVLAIAELVAELGGDIVHSHAVLDINLEFLEDGADLLDVLLGLGKVIDTLWRLLDPLNDLIELSSHSIVLLDGSLGNQLDFLVNN